MAPRSASPDEDEGVGPLVVPATSATEGALASLHGVVAEFLTLKLSSGKATAAEVGAAITFLKNNNITASPSVNKALADLQGTLATRKRRGELTPMEAKEATDHYDAIIGGMGMGSLQ